MHRISLDLLSYKIVCLIIGIEKRLTGSEVSACPGYLSSVKCIPGAFPCTTRFHIGLVIYIFSLFPSGYKSERIFELSLLK
ncbi:hypothetical protein DLD82_12480 [Methanospirillum stamsii]|uniref:Uncharacterized protein n=1 Tax=Methanospirillum stamsii TaxID=1277351 RepID=A0A2V2N7C1_9EURY|nr:hypothetical protein DLD82_12480 [Methanospirillum stamsii]